MNGNLSGTYESFLARCIGGSRKEQEVFQQLAKVMEDSEALEKRRQSLGLKEWGYEGEGELAESYLKGKAALEKDGDVYLALSSLKSLVAGCEKALSNVQEERQRTLASMTVKVAACAKKHSEMALKAQKIQKGVWVCGCVLLLLFALKLFGNWGWWSLPLLLVGLFFYLRKQGRKEVLNRLGMEMIPIPGKSYMMGMYPVTQALWKAVMDEKPSKYKGSNRPVECVSWDECQKFLKKLNALPSTKELGLVFRLPTEEEWIFACRADSKGNYCRLADGTEITETTLGRVAWFDKNSGDKTHPVGEKMPNAFGLFDMHGNVLEWTSTVKDSERIAKGGSYPVTADRCGANWWWHWSPSSYYTNLGVRLAAEGQEQPEMEKTRLAAARRKVRKAFLEAGCLALVALVGWYWCTQDARRQARVAKTLGLGAVAGESKTLVLPGGVEMEMVWCPPGSFMMGSHEGGRDEKPVHQVTLTEGFWLAKTEVTQGQWKSVMGSKPSNHEGDDLPVEYVNWDDCKKFCRKAGLRLPTEAEWEYACRAETTGDYGGTGRLEDMGWYRDNSGGETHPVGQKQPNEWGLYDMHGNVCEWCVDWYGDYPGGAVTNPKGASSEYRRVLRGGSWGSDAAGCRSASRGSLSPSDRFDSPGFRPASILSE